MLIHFTTFCVFMIFSSAWMILYTLLETSQPTAMKPPLKIPRANAPKRKLHLLPNPRKFQVQPTLGMQKNSSLGSQGVTQPPFSIDIEPFKKSTPFQKGKIIKPKPPMTFGSCSSCQFSGFHVLFQFSSGNIKALLLTSGFYGFGVTFLHLLTSVF